MDLSGLIPTFGNLAFTLAAFVVALSVIVAIHEYGHYIVGRWCGIKAEVFSLGFGPVLFSRTDKRGTLWQVAAVPLGGYVKFLGDSNAASAPDHSAAHGLTPDEQRMTLQGAPLWARAATVAAGPIFNFILAILVFAGVAFSNGTPRNPYTIAEIAPLPVEEVALQPGDELLEVGGVAVPEDVLFPTFVADLPQEPELTYLVRRDGAELSVEAPFPLPARVETVQPNSAAEDAGILVNDIITAIDGEPIATFARLREIVGESDGAPLDLTIWRDGETLSLTLTPRKADIPLQSGGFETRFLIGITGATYFSPATERAGVGEALVFGVERTLFIMRSSLSALYHVAAGAISTCNLSGPIGIAEASGDAAQRGTQSFIWFIAVLSAAVGLLNLLPVPVLDGGHLLFHAYEAITRRKPSEKVLSVLMYGGLTIVISFMLFALFNDIRCP